MNDKINPANDIKVAEVPHDYIPMSVPTQRLQVPPKAGFVRYWFRGDPARILRAQQAGYRFVDQSEVNVNNFDLGGDAFSQKLPEILVSAYAELMPMYEYFMEIYRACPETGRPAPRGTGNAAE